MIEFDKTGAPDPKRLTPQVEQLLRERLQDPLRPLPDEVAQLAADLLLRNAELENKVANLKRLVHQLEEYRDRYVDLYELAPVGYVTLDEEGYVQEINLAGLQLLGVERDELIGYPLERYVRSQDQPEFLRQIRRVCCERQVLTFDVGLAAKDGKSLTAQLRGVPIESLKSDATFCKIAITDITERRNAEDALRESEERFRTVADHTYDWESWRGADGRYRYVSPSCERITGYSPAEFMADPGLLERIVHPDDHQRMASHFHLEAPTAGPFQAQFRIIAKSGAQRWIEHICHPVCGADQRWLGQRASNRDITERKALELELRNRIADLEERWSASGRSATNG